MIPRVLLVDDDIFLANSLSRLLSANGFHVAIESTIADAWESVQRQEPHLLILDLSLPDGDGNELCRRLRTKYQFPILMLTSRSTSLDKVTGLGLGADDYLTKPFDPHELVARLRALQRRLPTLGGHLGMQPVIEAGNLTISEPEREVRVNDAALAVTPTEYALLRELALNQERAVERNELFKGVWGYDAEFASNTLDVLIYRLRGKLSKANSEKNIVTIRGHGFRLK
ncbi:MAG: response regulator transcription factor [Chthonomonas sp.]|nr:response regulator transcription factor [Chthonomonas sp.]